MPVGISSRGTTAPLGVRRIAAAMIAFCATLPAAASSNQPEWIAHASQQILTSFPRVDAFMWFNYYKPEAGEPDFRVIPYPPELPDPAIVRAYNNAWHGPTRSLSRGVFTDGVPWDLTRLDLYESHLGHHDRIGWFASFESPFPAAEIRAVQARGSRPYIMWEPYDNAAGRLLYGASSLLPAINAGDYDDRITEWATGAAANGQAIDISFGHEMNGNWYGWAYLPDNYWSNPAPITDENLVGHNGNTPKAFKEAFRRVVNLFDQAGASNVTFVWSVNTDWIDNYTISFPGISHVGRMGMSGFNWGRRWRDPTNTQYDDWREFEQIFGPWWPGNVGTYQTLANLNTLPIIVGDFATAPPPPTTPGDSDHDGDVDDDDVLAFKACKSGPAVPLSDNCDSKDLDRDGDVDSSDFGILQRCYSGRDNAPQASCGE